MKIEINLKIILAILLFLLIDNINTYLIFLFFILVHEIAHLIVGIALGGKPNKLTISLFGVSLNFYSYSKTKILYKIIFYAIGPIVNIIIATLIMWLIKEQLFIIKKIIIINYAIGIFNLLPILPLDGGNIIKEFLKIFFDTEKATKITIYFSKVILVIITLVYSILIIKIKNIIILFLIVYLWYLYGEEERKYHMYLKAKESINNIL